MASLAKEGARFHFFPLDGLLDAGRLSDRAQGGGDLSHESLDRLTLVGVALGLQLLQERRKIKIFAVTAVGWFSTLYRTWHLYHFV